MNDDKRTHGLWEASAPAAPATTALDRDLDADVVIVGGGFTGCSAALHIAEAGRRAVVLEACEIGYGGAGRNVGLVNAGLWVMPGDVPRLLGELHGERLLEQLGRAPSLVFELIDKHRIPCEVHREGTLHCAVGAKGFAEITQRASEWQKRGADVELLDAKRAKAAIGSNVYSGALLDRRAGTIQPLAYVRGLAKAALTAGANIFTGSPALAFTDKGDAWRISTANGTVTAPFVIVASDMYAAGVWTQLKREQIGLPYFNLATKPLTKSLRESILPGRHGAWDTKSVLSSLRFDDAGRLIVGSIGALRGTGTSIHRNWGKRELRRLFPQLSDVEFEHEWFGWIGMTDDAVPRFHQHARDIYSISGYNGRGIGPGTTFGRDLARLALGQMIPSDFSLPLTGIASPALRVAKQVTYEVGSQAVHLIGAR